MIPLWLQETNMIVSYVVGAVVTIVALLALVLILMNAFVQIKNANLRKNLWSLLLRMENATHMNYQVRQTIKFVRKFAASVTATDKDIELFATSLNLMGAEKWFDCGGRTKELSIPIGQAQEDLRMGDICVLDPATGRIEKYRQPPKVPVPPGGPNSDCPDYP